MSEMEWLGVGVIKAPFLKHLERRGGQRQSFCRGGGPRTVTTLVPYKNFDHKLSVNFTYVARGSYAAHAFL